MSLRIAVGGLQHESHSFAPHRTRYVDFLRPGGFPPLQRGAGLLDALRGTSTPCGGAIGAGEAAGAVLVPLAWALANPAGPIEESAFERLAALVCAELTAALDAAPLDGIYLDLHGAALSEHFPDVEGELLRRVRAIAGPLPIAISLDPHANLTAAMVALSDIAVPYRSYPHVDMRETGARAMGLLIERIARGVGWARAFRQLDFWMPITSQCTLAAPMSEVMAMRAEIGADIVELAFCFGFPYADFPDCGPAVAAYAETEEEAAAAADALVDVLVKKRAEFRLEIMSAKEAVAEAIRVAAGARRPVVIADTQDNPGGGGHGDTTGLMAELIGQKADGALVCLINDAESAAACHAAGQGAEVFLSLGGKSDGEPIALQARVLALSEGEFTLTGPMGAGNPAVLGPCALIGVDGVRAIVVSRKMQAYDQAIIRHLGVEPADCRIIALKSSVHFRADFGPIADRVIVAAAPGPVIADPSTLPFRHLRAGLQTKP